jgi:hypothetical protein
MRKAAILTGRFPEPLAEGSRVRLAVSLRNLGGRAQTHLVCACTAPQRNRKGSKSQIKPIAAKSAATRMKTMTGPRPRRGPDVTNGPAPRDFIEPLSPRASRCKLSGGLRRGLPMPSSSRRKVVRAG